MENERWNGPQSELTYLIYYIYCVKKGNSTFYLITSLAAPYSQLSIEVAPNAFASLLYSIPACSVRSPDKSSKRVMKRFFLIQKIIFSDEESADKIVRHLNLV